MSSKFWIEDTEKVGIDLHLFVECFGQNRAKRISAGIALVAGMTVGVTEFLEVVEQEVADGCLSSDDLYSIHVVVFSGSSDSDAAYDKAHDAIEAIFA